MGLRTRTLESAVQTAHPLASPPSLVRDSRACVRRPRSRSHPQAPPAVECGTMEHAAGKAGRAQPNALLALARTQTWGEAVTAELKLLASSAPSWAALLTLAATWTSAVAIELDRRAKRDRREATSRAVRTSSIGTNHTCPDVTARRTGCDSTIRFKAGSGM